VKIRWLGKVGEKYMVGKSRLGKVGWEKSVGKSRLGTEKVGKSRTARFYCEIKWRILNTVTTRILIFWMR